MPAPACWLSSLPRPRRRGRRWRSSASSTCALPSWVRAFWAKMSRITSVRSMAVRPRIFSRLRCWAGRQLVVEHDGVGVDRLGQLVQLLRPCPCRRRWRGRARRGAARRAPPRRRRRCRSAGPARRGGLRSRSTDVGGMVTPTSTMRSRKERSMQRHGSPPPCTSERLRSIVGGPARLVDRDAVADPTPLAGGGGRRVGAGAARVGEADAPLVHHHVDRRVVDALRDDLDVDVEVLLARARARRRAGRRGAGCRRRRTARRRRPP